MSVQTSSLVAKTDTELLVDLIIDSIQDIKGKRITKLDLRQVDDAPASYFVVCEGESVTQVNAIAQHISKRVREELQIRYSHLEGLESSKWVLVDYFDIVAHVFYPETRAYYDIEDLWNDAIITEYEDL